MYNSYIFIYISQKFNKSNLLHSLNCKLNYIIYYCTYISLLKYNLNIKNQKYINNIKTIKFVFYFILFYLYL